METFSCPSSKDLIRFFRSWFYLIKLVFLYCREFNFCSMFDIPCWFLQLINSYIFIIILLFCSYYNIALNLFVYSMIASLSHSSSEIVVNLIDDLMLLFYFFISSSYFLKLWTRIFVVKSPPAGLNLYFVILTSPGVLTLVGYYSSIFCSLTFSFSKVVILVFSFIFSDDKKLFFSTFQTQIRFSIRFYCCLTSFYW